MGKKIPKFGCITTVLTSSTRLPQKALLKIGSKRVIDHIIDRAKSIKGIDSVVICTSTNSADDVLVDAARQHGVDYFRGSARDRLGRILGAVEKFGLDFIITFDGDDLFCDPELIEMAIKQMKDQPCDLIKAPAGLVCGSFTFCISASALKRAYQMSATDDTEMYEVYLLETGAFKVHELKLDDQIFLSGDHIRSTLDYQEDLSFFQRIFEELGIKTNTVPLRDIIGLIQRKPEIAQINYFRQNDYAAKRENMRTHKKIKEI